MKKAEVNQKKIVEAGGLTSLLVLLRSFEDETVRRVAAGAIANLAMNGSFSIKVISRCLRGLELCSLFLSFITCRLGIFSL